MLLRGANSATLVDRICFGVSFIAGSVSHHFSVTLGDWPTCHSGNLIFTSVPVFSFFVRDYLRRSSHRCVPVIYQSKIWMKLIIRDHA